MRARVKLSGILVGTVLAISVGAATDTSASAARRCGSTGPKYQGIHFIQNITSVGVTCATAKHFVKAVVNDSGPCAEDATCTFNGWRCRRRAVRKGGSEWGSRIRCTSRSRMIRWDMPNQEG
jgi:hypothetical protein